MPHILNRVVSPLLVTAVLFVYAFNQYGTLALPGIPAGENFGLSGESRFIEFFYFVFFLLTLAGGFCCCLLTRLEIVRTAAGDNLMLRTAVVLQWWYIFAVLFIFFLQPFSFYFFLCLTALVFSSAATAFFLSAGQKRKSANHRLCRRHYFFKHACFLPRLRLSVLSANCTNRFYRSLRPGFVFAAFPVRFSVFAAQPFFIFLSGLTSGSTFYDYFVHGIKKLPG